MPTEFSQFSIKKFEHWELFLHKNQYPYIGRCYAWALREDAQKITDITREESQELLELIIPRWDKAIQELYQHTWPNVAILGNDAPHLHAHLIPRYNQPVIVHGVTFTDPNPKGNYSPYPKQELSLDFLLRIKDEISEKI